MLSACSRYDCESFMSAQVFRGFILIFFSSSPGSNAIVLSMYIAISSTLPFGSKMAELYSFKTRIAMHHMAGETWGEKTQQEHVRNWQQAEMPLESYLTNSAS